MAAEVLATAGHQVSVYDQRRSPARKFVLAGRGGLNITHSEPLDDFLDRYGPERYYLEPAIRAFTPTDLQAWCADLGHETFVGTSGRVFPKELRAVPLLRSWLGRLGELGVEFHLGHTWNGWSDTNTFEFEALGDSIEVAFDKAVLALGGASWPRVSSDGSWQAQLGEKQIEVTPLTAANCGVTVSWSNVMIERFAGEPVKNAALGVVDPSTGQTRVVRGDPIITTSGIEGGPVYAHSRQVRENLEEGESTITLDLFPDRDEASLANKLSSRRKGESAARWLRRCGVTPVGAALLREVTGNQLPSGPREMAALAKSLPLEASGVSGIDRAISSAGGVAWGEVDSFFRLRKVPDVYAVGEMLDWEAPTGGYLLQACFSTGRYAATAIAG